MGISKHDKQALSQLFIDMGVPLVVAMQTVESWSGEDIPLPQKAESLAKLLNVSVDFATKVTKKLDIRDAYTLENVRGRIIKIVTPIIAQSYVAQGQIPSSEQLKDLTDLFDVLVSFSDSVSPTEDDKAKPHYMATLIESTDPLLSVIHEHSFGLSADSLFNKIAEGLKARAQGLAGRLNVEDAIQSGLFRAVVKVYVSCYGAAVAKVEAGQHLSGEEALETIWKDCDERLALLHGLTSMVAGNVGIQVDEKPSTQSPAPAPVQSAQKADEPKAAPAEAPQAEDDSDDDGDFNPMAFFGTGG